MTPEEMDRKIAEFCGWKITEQIINDNTTADAWVSPSGDELQWDPPKYSADFNDMREAEQHLFTRYHDAKDIFIDRLCRIINPTSGYRKQGAIDIIDATAEQHARAFVETIGQLKP